MIVPEIEHGYILPMFQAPSVRPLSFWIKNCLLAAMLLLFSFFYIPLVPNFFSIYPSVDDSWLLAMHHFFEVKKQFGVEIVYTYGPYGFLTRWMYHPATFPVVLTSYIFLFFVFIDSSWFLLTQYCQNFWLRFGLWLAILLCALPPQEEYFFVLSLVAFLVIDIEKNRPSPARTFFLALALGLIALIKFTFVFSVLPVLVLAILNSLLSRRCPWFVVWFVFGFLMFWLLAGQNILNLGAYLRNSLELTAGYAYAMGSPSHPELRLPQVFFILSSVFLVITAFHVKIKNSLYAAVKYAGLTGWFTFLLFKCSFTRPSCYSISAFFFLIVLILFCGANFIVSRNQKKLLISLAIILLLALTGAAADARLYKVGLNPSQDKNTLWENFITPVRPRSKQIEHALKTGYSSIYYSTMRHIATKFSLPYSSGKVDIYSYRQAFVLATGLPYSPRPTIQSYAAYTEKLAAINAEYLASSRAPNSIYFAVEPADFRYGSLDDGLSWPELAARYIPKSTNGFLLLLEKVRHPRTVTLTPIHSVIAHWYEAVPVPPTKSGLVWSKVKFRPTPLNRLLGFLTKPVGPFMQIQTRSETKGFFIVPSLGAAGFLLSPFITTSLAFSDAFYATPANARIDNRVEKIMFFPDTHRPASWFFDKKIEVLFFELELTSPPELS